MEPTEEIAYGLRVSNPDYINCNVRLPVEQQQKLLQLAAEREVSLATVLRDAVNTYLGGDRGELFTGPEAGYLQGRNQAMQATLRYLGRAAAEIPTDPELIEAWVAEQLTENATGALKGRRRG